MKRYWLISACLLLGACSTLPPAIENAPEVDLSYHQVSGGITHYKNAPVRWGGVIIDLQNEQNYSLLQVMSYPLNNFGRPKSDESYQGRFLVKSSEFLDPAIYVKDKEVTVAGLLKDETERMIGNKTLKLPVLESTAIHLWPDYDKYPYYGGYGYYPYYWGGYYGFYPYYWGGYYRPYPRW